jgi:transcriptional regulator with XRE-family HTH domain
MVNGTDLLALRKSAGLTQTQLAEKLGNGGYTKGVVSEIEAGRRNIGLSLLTDWANACGYDVEIAFIRQVPPGTTLAPVVGPQEIHPDDELLPGDE